MEKSFTSLNDLIRGFANAMNLISPEVQNHHQKVAYLAYNIADAMGMSDRECYLALMGALLHDVGGVLQSEKVSLVEIERNAAALAKASAAVLHGHPLTSGLTDIVSNSQSPWRAIRALPKRLKNPVLIGQIVHLADTVSLMLDESSSVLNQVDHIRDCIESAGDTEFHPDVRKGFAAASRREALWMDLLYAPGRFLDFLPANRMATLDETVRFTELVSRIIDFRSPFTAMHSAGVAATAEALAELSGMSDEERKMMRIAGNLHDVGKLKIPKSILEKPGKLTDSEFNVMKEHAYYTYALLKDIRGFEQITQWAALHHEKLNGNGYPFRLSAPDIPLGSRIMAVADVFSAIAEDRPYRKGMDKAQALDVLNGDVSRGALSESVVRLLIDNYDSINERRDREAHAAGKRYYDAINKQEA